MINVLLNRYGYVDPLGEIREFTYENGIPCDPLTKQPRSGSSGDPSSLSGDSSRRGLGSARAARTGYYDYNSGRFVRPDGRKFKVVVNKANRARG